MTRTYIFTVKECVKTAATQKHVKEGDMQHYHVHLIHEEFAEPSWNNMQSALFRDIEPGSVVTITITPPGTPPGIPRRR